MVILTGKNLGERQRELNSLVSEVVDNKKNFDEIKIKEDANDIDRLYKIDIASKYKDTDYIIETFKSGDSLYISRALKCIWLYGDNYSHIINAENLNDNIFPHMSLKMKAKMLTTISMHIRNMERCADFYKYCKKNKMHGIEMKFLNFTSEEFKLEAIKNNEVDIFKYPRDLKNFIGQSFMLATIFIQKIKIGNVIHGLRYLYTVCNEKYLDLLEKYETADLKYPNSFMRLGIRISKDIMTKHKNRVLKNPPLYVNKLNKGMLVKYTNIDDVKKILIHLMPLGADEFWYVDFCKAYNFMLDLIPKSEKFEYVKQLFTCKYPGHDFEMSIQFYKLKYYEMLTIDERELWALRHIDGQKEILGSGNDYIWYKFVNFDKAFVEIKKYIRITPDSDTRSDILNVLVESAKEQNDLIKLFNYYYDRHVNEKAYYKEIFIDKTLSTHNVFEYNIECWEALEKILYSLEVCTVGNWSSNKDFKAIAVAFHILYNKDMPQALHDFLSLDMHYSYFTPLLEKLGKDKSKKVFEYILNSLLEKLRPFEQNPYNNKLRKKLLQYVHAIFNLLSAFNKADTECPEIVTRFMEIHSPKPEERKITAQDIYRLLKKDATLAVEVLSHFENDITCWPERFDNVLKKLKVYFSNDVAKEYIQFFISWLSKLSDDYSSYKVTTAAIFGLFRLADENDKVSLMEKYQPVSPKIDHKGDKKLLYIQEAICRLVGYSRPPVPLKFVIKYIKGDYVHFCLPIFNMYLVNLPLPRAVEFSESILNAPLSVQKHGLRTAFKCYPTNNLKILALEVWKKTKNISLRKILYKLLFDKVREDREAELYEVIKLYTSELHQDDHDSVFNLIWSNRMPDIFKNDFLQTSWDMIVKLPDISDNIYRQTRLINNIEKNYELLPGEFVYKRIIEEHIKILDAERLRPCEMTQIEALNKAKWHLTARYIVHLRKGDEIQGKLELLNFIFEKCMEMWNEIYEHKLVAREFCFNFIQYMISKSVMVLYDDSSANSVPIFQHILDILKKTCSITEIYLTVWELQLTIYARTCEIELRERRDLRNANEEMSEMFAKQIGTFVKYLLEEQQFYTVFLREMADILISNLQFIQRFLNKEKYFDISICESLSKFEMKETHLLILMILPANVSEEIKEKQTCILKKVHSFNNDEVQSLLYSKFLNIDFKNRLY